MFLPELLQPNIAFLPFLLPALIGGVATIAGGALKSSSDKKVAQQQNVANAEQAQLQHQYNLEAMEVQRKYDLEDRDEFREYSRQVYSHLVEDSEKAGFNPLTALRAGGGSSYNAGAALAPLSRSVPAQQAPSKVVAAGAGLHIGQSLMNVGQDFMSNFDPFRDNAREQGARLVDAQIRNLDASTANLKRAVESPPSFVTGQMERRQSGRAGQMSRGTGAGENGEILSMWTDWYDRNGNVIQLPNPDLPESEQFMVPWLGKADNAITRPIETHLNDKGWITSRPLTEIEKSERKETGWRRYVPSFGIEWK